MSIICMQFIKLLCDCGINHINHTGSLSRQLTGKQQKAAFLLQGGRYYLFWGEKGEYYKQHEMWVSNGCRDLSINMEKWQLGANAQHIKALFMGFNRGSLDWTLDNWGLNVIQPSFAKVKIPHRFAGFFFETVQFLFAANILHKENNRNTS